MLYNSLHRPRIYLLGRFKGMVQIFNAEHDNDISYHTVQNVGSNNRPLLVVNKTPDNDCILLRAIKANLSKANKHNLASKITGDAIDFVINIVCLVSECNYCNDSVKVVLANL